MSILPVLIFGTFALLFMAVAVISFVMFYQRRVIAHQLQIQQKEEEMQRELLRATLKAQEDEMQRIGKDLHDDIGLKLISVKNKVIGGLMNIKKETDEANYLEQAKNDLEAIRNEIRSISHTLYPSALDLNGLSFALEKICKDLNGYEGIKISFRLVGEYKKEKREAEITLYRIALECINNAIKHSCATEINATIHYTAQNILLEISDNGNGFDASDLMKQSGLGLKNIQSRAKAIGAELKFESSKSGTKVSIKYFLLEQKNQ